MRDGQYRERGSDRVSIYMTVETARTMTRSLLSRY